MLRVLIADDEAPARRKLSRFLQDHDDVVIVAEASNGIDAVDLIRMTKPDIAFLDVHMPDLDGLAVAQSLNGRTSSPAIVFVTAHDRYAVAAFEVRALDYLLKPYDRERFERALQRARGSARSENLQLPDIIAQARREERYAGRLLVPNEGRSFFVQVKDLVRIESEGNNVVLHFAGRAAKLRVTLESLEERLDPAHFVRVHRSHVLNIDEIAEIRPWFHGDYIVRMRDGAEVTWSRRYAAKRPDLLKSSDSAIL